MPGSPGVGSDSVNLLKEKLVLDYIFSSLFQYIALSVRNSFRTEPCSPPKLNGIQADDLKEKKPIQVIGSVMWLQALYAPVGMSHLNFSPWKCSG